MLQRINQNCEDIHKPIFLILLLGLFTNNMLMQQCVTALSEKWPIDYMKDWFQDISSTFFGPSIICSAFLRPQTLRPPFYVHIYRSILRPDVMYGNRRIFEESVVTYSKLLFRHLTGGTKQYIMPEYLIISMKYQLAKPWLLSSRAKSPITSRHPLHTYWNVFLMLYF